MFRSVTILACFAPALVLRAQAPVRYSQEIRPILSDNCFQCHGPHEADRQADMRLDVPGGVDFEELTERISSTDPDVMMPPPESHKQLDSQQIELLRRWVAEGAAYETHWSFVSPQRHETPEVRNATWSNQAIDRFVLARLEAEGRSPSAPVDKRTLIRRVTLDLTGLPPTPDELEEFLNDTSGQAYDQLVNRLLATPQYGEHMARYWLDLVRFADTNGLHHDHYREMTPYRDWVIRAFSDNIGFDQFIMDQIAGDLFDQPSIDQQIASGFNRLHLIIDVGTALPEESFTRNVVDRVTAVGTAFLGLTVQCAVCHDHKYDPITQRDFYQLYAFFNNFDGEPETGHRQTLDFKRGLQPPYLDLPSPEQEAELARLDPQLEKISAQIEDSKKQAQRQAAEQTDLRGQAAEQIDDARKARNLRLESLNAELKKIREKHDRLVQSIPATLIMKEREEVRPAHILVRGAYDQFGDEVERNTPTFLPPMKTKEGVKTRMDLAEWLTDPSHPLTARVAVNRFWQQFFGVGLVRTSEDFGAQGEPPSHPELLDHLALSFMNSNWDVKAVVRSIVLSQAYRQSSAAPPERFLDDPDNRLLARGSRFRLDAEVIRDQVLAVTGLLNKKRFGESVKPPQPPGLWKIVAMPTSYPNSYQVGRGNDIFRRSVYTFWKRGLPPPQMTILDAPTRESCIARRERTNTPLQALLLMNEQQYFRAAMHFAHLLLQAAPNNENSVTDAQLLRQAYERVTAHLPSEAVMSQLQDTLEQFRAIYRDDTAEAAAMLAESDDKLVHAIVEKPRQVELAAWTMLVHSLLNLDVTKTHE